MLCVMVSEGLGAKGMQTSLSRADNSKNCHNNAIKQEETNFSLLHSLHPCLFLSLSGHNPINSPRFFPLLLSPQPPSCHQPSVPHPSLESSPAAAVGSSHEQLQGERGMKLLSLGERRGAGTLQGKDVAAELLPKGE